MTISRKDAIKAFEAQSIITHPISGLTFGELTDEHNAARFKVQNEYNAFCDLVLNEMERWPLTKKYFGHLIKQRLAQFYVLDSVFISILFDIENVIEERIERIHLKVLNFESITNGIGAYAGKEKGLETDEKILDLWNEIFVVDVLIDDKFGFENIEKVVRSKGQPQVDFLATYNGIRYLIEAARLRKVDFECSAA